MRPLLAFAAAALVVIALPDRAEPKRVIPHPQSDRPFLVPL
jgi:hypothetical protein